MIVDKGIAVENRGRRILEEIDVGARVDRSRCIDKTRGGCKSRVEHRGRVERMNRGGRTSREHGYCSRHIEKSDCLVDSRCRSL